MTEEQLSRGIVLARAGENAQARKVLGQVVQSNPRSVEGWIWLASVVETREQQRYCLERVLQLDPQNRAARQVLTQIAPQTVESAGSRASVVPQQGVGTRSMPVDTRDLREIVADVFGPLEYTPYCADGTVQGQPSLLEICQKIFSTGFGVYDLSSQHANVYIEMGIALGLNRPIVAIARDGSPLPSILEGHNVIRYADRADLSAKLSALCEGGFPPTTQSVPDYCHFCGRVCPSMSTPLDENAYLVLHHSRLLWRNLMRSLEPHLAGYDLHPVYLSGRASGSTLCDVRRKVISSQFALCHLGALSNENSFLSLGMAIGSRVPWILLYDQVDGLIPADLEGSDMVEYVTFSDLEERLTETLGVFLSRVMPGTVAKTEKTKTTTLSLPFWVQLQDWLERAMRAARASDEVEGEVRVAQYDGQECLSKHSVTKEGLLVGRGSDCDVVVENQSVSSRHFRILRGRMGRYFVQDLQSKNGTFLNGIRLPPGKRVQVNLTDAIRIPGARFLIWDDRPLPEERAAQRPADISALGSLTRIEIPDVPPPAYLDTWDRSIVLTALLPDGHSRSRFQVQAYYPMGRILSRLVDLLGLPKGEYGFTVEGQFIEDGETPLSLGMQRGDLLRIVPRGSGTG